MIFDPLKPYIDIIRVVGYITILSAVFITGCNIGKHKQTVKVAELETSLGVCKDANKASQDTIKALKVINAEYASQSDKQAEDVAQAQKDLKTAQRAIQAQEKAFNKELSNVYKKNPDWAKSELPSGIKRVFNSPDTN